MIKFSYANFDDEPTNNNKPFLITYSKMNDESSYATVIVAQNLTDAMMKFKNNFPHSEFYVTDICIKYINQFVLID